MFSQILLSFSIHQYLTLLMNSIQAWSTSFNMRLRQCFSPHHQHHPRTQAKTATGLDRQDFEVELHHHIFTIMVISLILRALRHVGSQLHQVIPVILWRALSHPATFMTTTAKKGRDVHIQTVADHSKTSKPICLPINPRGLRSVH